MLQLALRKWLLYTCLLYTSDAADEEDSVDLGGCRTIEKKKKLNKKKKKTDQETQTHQWNPINIQVRPQAPPTRYN